ncbi:MAG: hypothetical protein Q7S76_00950, partial [bacterium]|nr:hypothetical protein [bacterium]
KDIKGTVGAVKFTAEEGKVTLKQGKWTLGQYDLLILVDGTTPVVVEIKLTGKKSAGKGQGINYALQPQRVEELLIPLSQRYKRDVGMVFIGYYTMINPVHGSTQDQFLGRGGAILPFPYTPQEHLLRVHNLAESLGFLNSSELGRLSERIEKGS